MEEKWADIKGYEGLYQVSSNGNVRSLDRYVPHKTMGQKFCKGRMMATHVTSANYLCVNLCKNNKYTSYDVHRLVAVAFLGVDDVAGLEVNHIDENKRNNRADNLEWVTKSQNNMHGTKRERHARKIRKAILQCDLDGNVVNEWASATEAEKVISGKFSGAISHCINGKTKTAFGYIWRFKEVR